MNLNFTESSVAAVMEAEGKIYLIPGPCIIYIVRRSSQKLQPIFKQFVNLINHNTIQWYSR